jgi:ribonuclease J
MNFIIHRGAHEIGGSCVEVSCGNTRIILDVGLPLDHSGDKFRDSKTRNHFPSDAAGVPKVPGLFQVGPQVDAILISHAHADHAGLLNYADPKIPVYCTKGTSKMQMAGSIFARQVELEKSRQKTVVPGKPIRIGDFTVTAFSVDHSAFDSAAFLIETDGQRLLYSGDLRLHGRKPGMAEALLAGVAGKPIDVLLMEGTHFSGQRAKSWTEKELEHQLSQHFIQVSGLVLANFSPLHVDRLVSFYKAARTANRTFVLDPYAAFVLHLAAGQSRVPNPEAKNGIRIYYNQHFERTWNKRHLGRIHKMFSKDRIEMEAILAETDKYVMVCRPSMFKDDFRGTFPPHTIWIYSYWEGYLDRPESEYPALEASLKKAGGAFLTCHTSGHIFAEDIEKFAKAVNPVRVVPIHTAGRSEFQRRFKNVLLLEDRQIYEVI